MATVGVRVERFVRLGRGVEGLEVAHYLHLLVLHFTCQSELVADALAVALHCFDLIDLL
jgi:hypothetical protein